MRIKPNNLHKGDKVAIVATAKKISFEEISFAVTMLNDWGLIPVIGSTIGKENDQFAGTDKERVFDFQNMLDAKEIKAIWCARGGYGTVRIIDQLDFTYFKENPKWIFGYSDITVLHSHIHKLGFQTLHAPMPIDIHKASLEVLKKLQDVLFGKKVSYVLPISKDHKLGKCEGELVGGNLSILYSLCGSNSALETKGKILCIEDLDEYLYHIDRMLQNLKRNGYFENLSGLIVGGMTKMNDNPIPFGKTAKEIILDIVSEYNFPVVFDFPMGHIDDNTPLLLGAEAKLIVQEESTTLEYI